MPAACRASISMTSTGNEAAPRTKKAVSPLTPRDGIYCGSAIPTSLVTPAKVLQGVDLAAAAIFQRDGFYGVEVKSGRYYGCSMLR
mmetsp:Transcript_22224/g.63763  ORF Transcript_22224/g.63763 Transcript_22224/m.63763 type:complete len:86 (+) Transcript_22224:701-958(+)